MRSITRGLHIFFSLTVFFQLIVISYVIISNNNPQVPIHFSFGGTADSFGNASEYYLLIGINILVYIITFLLGKKVKVDMKKFHRTFKNKEDEINAQNNIKTKIQVFLQVLSTNFSLFISVLIALLLNNIINDVTSGNINSIGIVAFFLSNLIIIIVGLIWINTFDK